MAGWSIAYKLPCALSLQSSKEVMHMEMFPELLNTE